MAPRLELIPTLSPAQADAVLALRDRLAEHDGSSPLSDHVVLALRMPVTDRRQLLAWSGDEVVGYAHLEPSGEAELVVAPDADPGPLLDELSRLAGPALTVWARGDRSTLAADLPNRGFIVGRVLLQMRRPLDGPLPAVDWPAGVTVRSFVVGEDEAAWVTVNNLAFAGHPDQSGWTIDDLLAREHEAWFDPVGFFLAERDGDLVGFHWTKVHAGRGTDDGRIGEIYVIGVSPVMQGHRLGEALAVHGIRYLADRGLPAVMLYVEESNSGAIRLYEKLGFARWDADRCFKRS